MAESHRRFIPAAGHDWLLPFYDPLLRLFGGESARSQLIEQAAIRPGQRVLDIGCGTGSLIVMLKRLHPDVAVVGLDPDAKALARARRKAERAGLCVRLDEGFSDALPYTDESFDRVLSSFMFHHLEHEQKKRTLVEVRRVLRRPGGSLHLLDFGGSGTRADGLLARLIHSAEPLEASFEDRIPALMQAAGLADASELGSRATLFGRAAYFSASVSQAGSAATP